MTTQPIPIPARTGPVLDEDDEPQAPATITVNVRFVGHEQQAPTQYVLDAGATVGELRDEVEQDAGSPYHDTNFAFHPLRIFYAGVQLVDNYVALIPGGTYWCTLTLFVPLEKKEKEKHDREHEQIFPMDEDLDGEGGGGHYGLTGDVPTAGDRACILRCSQNWAHSPTVTAGPWSGCGSW